MNAYIASCLDDDRFNRADGVCQHYLPRVACEACQESWLDTEVWYPLLSLDPASDISKYSRGITVSPGEFKAMMRYVKGDKPRCENLLPGAGIGPVHAKLPKKATDFIWCCFKLLASHRAIDALKNAGIQIPHGPVVDPRTGADAGYVALELDPIQVYSERTLTEMTLVSCPECGGISMQDVRAKCKGPREFIRRRIPKDCGLVRVASGVATLATVRFMEVVQTQRLTGIQFEEFGVYV